MTPAKYPGTLRDLLPNPPRPNDAWAKDVPPPAPAWAGNISTQKRPRKK